VRRFERSDSLGLGSRVSLLRSPLRAFPFVFAKSARGDGIEGTVVLLSRFENAVLDFADFSDSPFRQAVAEKIWFGWCSVLTRLTC
jgi:hypothetical protein